MEKGEAETVNKMNTVKEKLILPWIIGKCLQGRPHPQKAPVSTVQMDRKEIVQLLRSVLAGSATTEEQRLTSVGGVTQSLSGAGSRT